jgi:hypothetical protein
MYIHVYIYIYIYIHMCVQYCIYVCICVQRCSSVIRTTSHNYWILEGHQTAFNCFWYQFTAERPLKSLKRALNCYEDGSTHHFFCYTKSFVVSPCTRACVCMRKKRNLLRRVLFYWKNKMFAFSVVCAYCECVPPCHVWWASMIFLTHIPVMRALQQGTCHVWCALQRNEHSAHTWWEMMLVHHT